MERDAELRDEIAEDFIFQPTLSVWRETAKVPNFPHALLYTYNKFQPQIP